MGDMLSQAEIDALLGPQAGSSDASKNEQSDFTDDNADTMSKIGNDTMSVSSKTLNALLRQDVVIGNPKVERIMLTDVIGVFPEPSVGIRIDYKIGVLGSNILILEDMDAKVIASLMMGGDGSGIDPDEELSAIDESALGECMNQMVGSSSTVLFKLLGEKVDIDTPKIFALSTDEEGFIKDFGFEVDTEVVVSTFSLKIGSLVDSKIVQVMPYEFAMKLINSYNQSAAPEPEIVSNEQSNNVQSQSQSQPQQQSQQFNNQQNMNYGQQNMNPNMGMNMMSNNNANINQQNINAQSVQFQNFDYAEVFQQKENMGIILDVPLEVTVEMGRTIKSIEEILEFSPGTIIELEKLAGDPIDILVNGKYVAKGEVVVIDENYGIRVTDIVNVKNRI